MTDELKDEQAIWPLLMARVRALPEGDVLAFELEGCGIAIQTEFTRLRRELADTRQALDHANEELTALREYLGPENARLTNELAEARAIGEQPRITKVEAATLTDAMRYPDNGALHCRWCSAGPREGHESRCWYAEQVRRVDAAKRLADELSARAATGEPKVADRG